jgi:hypothetical protein
VALDDDGHVYWTGSGGNIGRANLDGTNAVTGYLSVPGAWSVAIAGGDFYAGSTTGGSGVWSGWLSMRGSELRRFATGAGSEGGLAADRNWLYWANPSAGTIGRATPSGAGLNAAFIAGASNPKGVAVDAEHVFWTNRNTGTIGRANLDGSGAVQRFIGGASNPSGVAVDRGPAGTPSTPYTAPLVFRPQAVGTFGSALSVPITNTGHGDLRLDTVRSIGDEFVVTFDGCSHTTLAIGESCTMRLRFGPSQTGQRIGGLMIYSNDPASPLYLELQGTGTTPPPGPPGPAGPAGPQGPPGQMVVVVCTTVGDNTACGPSMSATAKLAAVGTARATLTLRGTLYASGTARNSRVKLRARRHVSAGRYTLTLRYRKHGRKVVNRVRITLR